MMELIFLSLNLYLLPLHIWAEDFLVLWNTCTSPIQFSMQGTRQNSSKLSHGTVAHHGLHPVRVLWHPAPRALQHGQNIRMIFLMIVEE